MERNEDNYQHVDVQGEVISSDTEQDLHLSQQYHNPNKNKTILVAIVVIIGFLLVGLGVYYLGSMNSGVKRNISKDTSNNEDSIACTLEAKECPDGSYVGRIGPNCEFEKCPDDSETEAVQNEWVSYADQDLGISFSHPSSWEVNKDTNNPDFKGAPHINIRVQDVLFFQSYHDRINSDDYYGQEPERIMQQNTHGPIIVGGKEYELTKVLWEERSGNQGSEQSTFFVDIPDTLSIGFTYQVFKDFDESGIVISSEYAVQGNRITDAQFNQLIDTIYEIISTLEFKE